MTASKFRVCAMIGGELRNFTTVEARRNGDVIISPRWRPVTRPEGVPDGGVAGDPNAWRGVRNEHFSIHVSAESPRQINTIAYTVEFDDGERQTQALLTEAIKKDTGFAHILTRRCPMLDHDEHKFKGKNSKIINIGDVEDGHFTLLYGVFVSKKDRKFFLPTTDPFNTCQFIVNGFNIIILYTFLTIAPHAAGMEKTAFSRDRRDPATGMIELQCADRFRSHILEMREELLNILDQENIPESARWFARQSTFFKHGVRNTQECQAWWLSLKSKHVARFGWRPE